MWQPTDLSGVVSSTKDELGSTVVPRADVGHVGFVLNQDFRASKITEFEDSGVGVEKQILRLDVAMADALGMDVRERPEQLVDIQLDFEDRHGCLHLVEEPRSSVHRLGHKFLDKVEVHFIFLQGLLVTVTTGARRRAKTYPLPVGVVEGLQLNDVGVSYNSHDLKLTVLQ